MTNDERLKMFIDEIRKESVQKETEINSQTDSAIAQLFNSGKTQIDSEINEYINNKCNECKVNYAEKISEIVKSSKNELFCKRDSVSEELFSEIRHMLDEFVSGDEYKKYLSDSYNTVTAEFGEPIRVYVRANDLNLIKEIISSETVEFNVEPSIMIGGIEYLVRGGRKFIDDTLDSKLKKEFELFTQNSGLIIS
mgnify:FL=1